MLNTYINPLPAEWTALLKRPEMDLSFLRDAVSAILEDVQNQGDEALRSYTQRFDGAVLDSLVAGEDEIRRGASLVSPELKAAIDTATANITKFHSSQVNEAQAAETMPGVLCWRRSVGIESVGLYVPGGSAPLFSTVLMLGIPAKIAGCREVVLCTPPLKNGSLHPAVCYAAICCGITKIYKAGGAQAIAAMAYGTASVPRVSKIFGPGNQYVTCAKLLVSLQGVAIDMPAGPSELAVIADRTAIPAFVAADLLSQAEHGPDSQVLLFATEPLIVEAVKKELLMQAETLPRKETALKALENSRAFVFDDRAAMLGMVDQYAPEHLIIATADAMNTAKEVSNAGSVFIGNYTPESAGDYASGTNHTLPTNGYAKMYSGVSVDSFVRKITFQHITEAGLKNLGPTIELMAEAEGLEAHRRAVSVRNIKNI
jgi:histidinol dehydrogenase